MRVGYYLLLLVLLNNPSILSLALGLTLGLVPSFFISVLSSPSLNLSVYDIFSLSMMLKLLSFLLSGVRSVMAALAPSSSLAPVLNSPIRYCSVCTFTDLSSRSFLVIRGDFLSFSLSLKLAPFLWPWWGSSMLASLLFYLGTRNRYLQLGQQMFLQLVLQGDGGLRSGVLVVLSRQIFDARFTLQYFFILSINNYIFINAVVVAALAQDYSTMLAQSRCLDWSSPSFSLILDVSLSAVRFLPLMLNSLASRSLDAAFLSHQCMPISIRISTTTHTHTKISGTKPRKPWKLLPMILGISCVASLMAVGENKAKTPTRQISRNSTKGTIRKMIDKKETKYFWSFLGPHAWKQLLSSSSRAKMPTVENTCWKQLLLLLRNKYREESKNGSSPMKLLMPKHGVAMPKQKNWQTQKWANKRAAKHTSWKPQLSKYMGSPLSGLLLMPPLHMETPLVTHITSTATQPVISRARKLPDCTQPINEQLGLLTGSKLSLMHWYLFCSESKLMSLFMKKRGLSVRMVVVERRVLELSTRWKLMGAQLERTWMIAMEVNRNGRKNTKMYRHRMVTSFRESFSLRSLEDSSAGMRGSGCAGRGAGLSLSYSWIFSCFYRFSSSSYSMALYFFSGLLGFSDFFSSLEPNLIYSLPCCSAPMSSTTTCLVTLPTSSLRLTSAQLGLLPAFRSRHLPMSCPTAGDILSLLMSGFLLGSKMGNSRASTLCSMKPKNHMSIFYLECFCRFSTRIMSCLSSGAQQSMLFLLSRNFFSTLSLMKVNSPRHRLLLCTATFRICRLPMPPFLSSWLSCNILTTNLSSISTALSSLIPYPESSLAVMYSLSDPWLLSSVNILIQRAYLTNRMLSMKNLFFFSTFGLALLMYQITCIQSWMKCSSQPSLVRLMYFILASPSQLFQARAYSSPNGPSSLRRPLNMMKSASVTRSFSFLISFHPQPTSSCPMLSPFLSALHMAIPSLDRTVPSLSLRSWSNPSSSHNSSKAEGD